MLARNLPGICSELGVCSEFARNSLEKRPGPTMRGTLHRGLKDLKKNLEISSEIEYFGIVQKVVSEKASAIARMRQKCVRHASKSIGQRGTFQNASEMRQNCARDASTILGRTPFRRRRKFVREWNFRASHPPRPNFCGEIETSRLKFSSEIEEFERDLKIVWS